MALGSPKVIWKPLLRHTLSVRYGAKLHSGLECELGSVLRSALQVRSPGCMSFSQVVSRPSEAASKFLDCPAISALKQTGTPPVMLSYARWLPREAGGLTT
jgi:hypothetical protein